MIFGTCISKPNKIVSPQREFPLIVVMTEIFENEEMKYAEAHGERKLDLFRMVEVTGLGIAELDRQKSAEIKKLADVPTLSPKPYAPAISQSLIQVNLTKL